MRGLRGGTEGDEMKECECDTEHTIAKLGHCIDCPHYKRGQPTQVVDGLGGCALYDRHADGSPHDFEWATYSDDTTSTGVCRCGLHAIHYDMARLP